MEVRKPSPQKKKLKQAFCDIPQRAVTNKQTKGR